MRGMIRVGGAVVAMALLALPLAAQGRGQGPAAGGRGMMMGEGAMARNPAAMVLNHQDALELTAEQRSMVEAIRDRVESENAPRHAQLRAVFGDADPREMTPEEREALRTRMRELQPVRAAIQATNRAAGAEIHELLTAEQEDRLRPLMRADRPGRGGGPGDRHHPHRGKRGPRGGG